MAKQFFYISMGILALCVSFHLVSLGRAEAQGASPIVGFSLGSNNTPVVLLENGDIWKATGPAGEASSYPGFLAGNIFDAATATEKTSWGAIKREFK